MDRGGALPRALAIFGSAVFLVIAPGCVAVLVPWWISHWILKPPFFHLTLLRLLGGAMIGLGALGLLDSFARFALQGFGTPAPVFPTRRLVITGWYRHVRNPMYLAVMTTIIGQALLFGNVRLLEYGAGVWVFFYLFVLVYEEPTLRAAYGAEYDAFCSQVPRWIPRLRPWRGAPGRR